MQSGARSTQMRGGGVGGGGQLGEGSATVATRQMKGWHDVSLTQRTYPHLGLPQVRLM